MAIQRRGSNLKSFSLYVSRICFKSEPGLARTFRAEHHHRAIVFDSFLDRQRFPQKPLQTFTELVSDNVERF